MVLKRIELAYPGMHGQSKTPLTEEMIQDSIRNFSGVVPATVSHEAANEEKIPAVGRVIRIDRPKERLEAVVELSDNLAKLIDNREVNSWSPGFAKGSNGWYLHHLAFSGSVPGKMQDLKILQELKSFADGDDREVLIYSDEALSVIGEENEADLVSSLLSKIEELADAVKKIAEEKNAKEKEEKKKEFADQIQRLQKI